MEKINGDLKMIVNESDKSIMIYEIEKKVQICTIPFSIGLFYPITFKILVGNLPPVTKKVLSNLYSKFYCTRKY